MDINIDFSYHIEKAQEGYYFRIPVDIPDNICRVDFTYDYSGKNKVDFGLEGPDEKFRGTCGSERKSFYLSETVATPGYIPGPIDTGRWNILLGAYKIEKNGCDVTLTVKMQPKQAKWYRGDLHLHSVNSDGVYEPEELAKQSAGLKLDFIAITDHNSWAHNILPPKICGVTVIPGMELTYYKGHANLFGVARPVSSFVANSGEEVTQRLIEAADSGALVSLNHPFCRNCGWHFGFDQPFEAVEVWNGPMKVQELDAIEWWHGELCRGRKLTAIGGSDMHKHEAFRTIGTPTTWVLADSDGPSDILKAIRTGRCAISWQPKGPLIEIEIGGARIGDSVSFQNELEGKIKVSSIEKGDIIRLINSNGCVMEIYSKHSGTFEYIFETENYTFYRAEILREVLPGIKMLVGLCNPVFID